MPQYRLIEKAVFERLASVFNEIASIKEAIALAPLLAMPDSKEEIILTGEETKERRKPLADVIYEKVDLPQFSTREVYEIVKNDFGFKGPRYLDSIRMALNNDSRFVRVESGLYRKAE